MADDSFNFDIRPVVWSEYELTTPILLQDANGPCPLIALVNTLLMKSDLEIFLAKLNDQPLDALYDDVTAFKMALQDQPSIALPKLLAQLAHLLMAFSEKSSSHYDIDNLLSSLPLLHTGLSINPNVTDGDIFQDLAFQLFSIFDLKIKHGWVVDPKEDAVVSKVSQLQFFDSIQDNVVSDPESMGHVERWLQQNSTQLTSFGLKNLDNCLQEKELIVFFRNNHFSTLYKKDADDLYLLVTDSSFGRGSKIVWQSLISASGKDDLFFTGDFLPVFEDTNAGDADMAYVRQLQEKEDERLAKQMQQSYEKRKPPVKEPKPDKKEAPAKAKKKGTCTIV